MSQGCYYQSEIMMKNLIRAIFLLTFVLLFNSAVYPCDCTITEPSEKLREAEAVFVGQVVEIGSNDKSGWATVSIKFKVERYWKGIKEQFVTVASAPGICCTCGLPVKIGEKFLIYAYENNGQLETSLCTSLGLEYAKEELKIIRKGKKLKLKK